MDKNSIGIIVFFGLFGLAYSQNKYNDHGIVITARTLSSDGDQLVAMPVVPRNLVNYTSRTFPSLSFADDERKLHACDVDYDRNLIYIYDYNYRQLIVGSNFNTSLIFEQIDFTKEHYGISQEYVKIAVDWISHNIYWTDAVMGQIVMQPGGQGIPNGQFKVIINTDADLPRGIAVDPISGYLFWTDFSKKSKIERASLLGKNRKILVPNGLTLPDDVAADHDSQRIYFTDKNYIGSVTYEGKDRQTHVVNTDAYFFDLAIFKDVLMVTDIASPYYMHVYEKNTTTGKMAVPKEGSKEEAYFGLCMYHKDIQPSASDRCTTAGCGDMCVDEPGMTEPTCVCRLGHDLNADNKTCTEKEGQYYRAIVLNNGTHLCLLDIRILSDHHNYTADCFYKHTEPSETITYIDVNMKSREVYFSTENKIYRVKIDKQQDNAVKLTETLPNNHGGNGLVTGLTFDHVSSHLYWTETDPDGVFVLNPDSPAQSLQLVDTTHNSTYPRAVLVSPHERRLYWLSGNRTAAEEIIIQYTDLGASAPVTSITPNSLPSDTYLSNPTHMYENVNDQRLYILDQGWGELVVLKYDGTYEREFNAYYTRDFALYKDYLLIMEYGTENNTVLTSADLGFGYPLHYVADGFIEGMGIVISIRIIDPDVLQPTYKNPCSDLNGKAGGCDQICFTVGEEAVCYCDAGFTLNSDNKTCDSTTVEDNFCLVSDSTNSKVLQIDLDQPDVMHGVQVPALRNLKSVFYNYLTGNILVAGAYADQIWSTNLASGNSSLLKDVSSEAVSPYSFALDPSTGNLYFTGVSYWAYFFDWSIIGVISPSGQLNTLYEGGYYFGDIVLHPGRGLMFWTETSTDAPAVHRAAMDGSNAEVIASGTDIQEPTGLAIDYEENFLYWTDVQTGKIFRCSVDGDCNDKTVFYEVEGTPTDIRIVGDYLYFAVKERSYITKMLKSNTSVTMQVGPSAGVGVLEYLDIYISSEVSKIPKNSVCSVNNGGCTDFCFPTPNSREGRKCGCEDGYELLVDETTCEMHGCPAYVRYASIDPLCLRTPGHQCDFTCFADLVPKEEKKLTCLNGLVWDDDSPCEESKYVNKYGDHGIVLTARGFVLDDFSQIVAIPETPRDIPNYTSRTFPGMRFADVTKKLHACDVDYNMNRLYLYDYEYRSILVADNFNTSVIKDAMNFTTEHHSISPEYVKIAVDWVSHNIYWTDSVMDAIMMQPGGQNIDPNLFTAVIQYDLHVPRGLAVDPMSGYIFWSDLRRGGRIERSSLLGKNREAIIVNALAGPDAIAADHATERIYFTNRYSIESATYDGRYRIHLVKNTAATFFDISVYQDVVMATDISNYYLYFYDTSTGEEAIPQEGSSTEGYFGVCMYDGLIQPTTSKVEICEKTGCEDICVYEPNIAEGVCMCRLGYELNADGKTCKEAAGQYHRAIILNNGTHLCFLDIRILSDHHDHKPDCFYHHADTSEAMKYIDLKMDTREVFFATERTIYRLPLDNRNASPAKLATAPGSRSKGEITGLSYDWINNHLYWSETEPDGVFLINPDDPEEFIQIVGHEDTFSPRAVLVVPHNRQVYWLATNSSGNDSRIEYGDLGVTAPVQSILSTDYPLNDPTHIYHDIKDEQFFILDHGWHSIIQASYKGDFKYYYSSGDAKDFAIYKGYMLIMEHDKDGNTRLYSGDIGFPPPLTVVAEGKVDGIGAVVSIKVIDADTLQPQYPSPCGENEGKFGPCEQICVPVSEQEAKCLCDTGFTLNIDNRSCDSEPVMDDFIIVTDPLHNKVFQISLHDLSTIHGIKLYNKEAPSGILYNYQTSQVVWGSEDTSVIWGVELDGLNSTVVSSLRDYYGTPSSFALDPTTGNIYTTAISYSYYYDSFIAVISPSGGVQIIYNQGHSLGDIVIHPKKGYMFWTDYGTPAMVARAGMDGSDITIIAEDSDALFPVGLAIDFEEDMLYWTDSLLHTVYRSDLDGGNKTEFHKDTGYMVDIDLLGNYLYYTGLDNLKITRINKNDPTDIAFIGPESGVGNFGDLYIYSSKEVAKIPVNDACSKNNGGCSHLCLPNGKGGNTCGCEDLNELLSDGKTCENVPRCEAMFSGGKINEGCYGLPGQECNFTCNMNLRPKEGVSKLVCQTTQDGELRWNVMTPCEDILCAAVIPNGLLPENCSLLVGAKCDNYTCDRGYERNEDVTYLNCSGDGTWSTAPAVLCKEKCPPFSLDREMATIPSSCKRDPDESCEYKCKYGYKPTSETTTITCLSGSTWNTETTRLCHEIFCRDYIPDGRIHEGCNFTVDSKCTFDCDERFDHHTKVYMIQCLPNGTWTESDKTLCIPSPPIPEKKVSDNVVVGLGAGLGIAILILLIILIAMILYRMGKLPGKKTSGTSGSSFENPRYEESSFDAIPGASGQANKDFSYATLEEDKLELTDESWKKTQARAPDNVYDNSPATIPATAINPKF